MSEAPERIWVAPDGEDIIIHNGQPNLDTLIAAGHMSEYVSASRIKELEAELAKATEALEKVQAFVRELEPYADQGNTLVPALREACETFIELKRKK
jgi:hypothetical protein